MTTRPRSHLLAYTGGRPFLEVVDLEEQRKVPLATPADRYDNAVDHALVRDGYVALHSGTEVAFSIPLDLRGAAKSMGVGWSSVAALDDRLVWLRLTTARTEERIPHVLVDREGAVLDRLDLPDGLRLIGESRAGLVVASDGAIGTWDRANAAVVNEHSAWWGEVVAGRWVLLLFSEQLSVWDTESGLVRPLVLPTDIGTDPFPRVAPGGSLVAWASGNYSSARRAIAFCDVATGEVQAFDTGFEHVGSLCWSSDVSRVYFASYDDPLVRCLTVDGETQDVRLNRAPGNLLCDLGDSPSPITHRRLLVDFAGAAPGRVGNTTSERALRQDVGAALRDVIGRPAAKAVLDLCRPALVLEPADSGASWIGGAPLLGPDGEWPVEDGQPLAHLATLDVTDLRRAWRGLPISTKGRLSFFFGPVHADGGVKEACAVIPSGSKATPAEPPPGLEVRFQRVPVQPRLVLTLPVDLDEQMGSDVALSAQELLDELFDATGPRHQVGGHARWIQGLEAGELLLQVDGDSEAGMTWGDGGLIYFVTNSSPVKVSDVAGITATLQCF